jgi:putative transposase
MAWRINKVEEQRKLFINAYLEEKFNFSDLCRQFEISRKCGYKWIKRYNENGFEGLLDHSKAPKHQPNKTQSSIIDELLRIKYLWPRWGPKKVLGHLIQNSPDIKWPCLTTVENIFNDYGLVKKRKLRKRLAERTDSLGLCNSSNDLWCIDFKGWGLTKDGFKIDPFTVMDGYSRFLLCCQKLFENNTDYAWAVLDRLFREYGLPVRIRSDNGPPFATLGVGRLSPLSIRLIKAGVMPEWIDPGEPQQNGRLERMHLTLEQEGFDLTKDLNAQLRKLEAFKEYYNFTRPHEALDQKSPGKIYQYSSRYWDGKLRAPEYPREYKVGRVKSCGKMSWKNKEIYVGRSLTGEVVGLKQEEELKAYYGPIYLGVIKDNRVEFSRRLGRIKN